jgi:putative NADH-flavin reductase
MRSRDSTTVEITVEGQLDGRWGSEFQGMELLPRENGTTVIRGRVSDQAVLHGLLRRVRDSGMALIAVEHIDTETERRRERMDTNHTTKRVLIIGATGRSGSAVLKRALERGHLVTALARSPEKVTARDPNLRVVQGDVLSPASLEPAIVGQDAVVSCLGAGLKGGVRSEGTRNVIRAMEGAGVRRLISQSSLGVGESRDNLNMYWKHIMFGLLLRKAYADHGLQEQYVRESSLDWTLVRPAALVDGNATGTYSHGFAPKRKGLDLKVSLADLAEFVVGELENPAYLHMAPGLSY